MKKVLLLVAIFALAACHSTDKNGRSSLTQSSVKDSVKKQEASKPVGSIPIASAKKDSADDITKKLTGVWIIKGAGKDDNANFVISKSTIYYLETDATYPYKIVKDSIVVKYDDYVQHMAFKFKGVDTLVLVNEDGTNIFYRVKK